MTPARASTARARASVLGASAARALLAIAAVLVASACAEAPPPMTTAQPAEAPPSLFGGAGRGTSPVDEQMLAIARAEDEIDKLFPHAGKSAEPGKKAGASRADKPADMKKGAPSKDDAPLSANAPDSCAVACRALESMRTSADHLCKLAGEGDGRCEDARGRVRGATTRVRSVCPECTATR